MSNLKRVGRTIIATGGVNTPDLEKLDNGDILASYRRYQDNTGKSGFTGWIG